MRLAPQKRFEWVVLLTVLVATPVIAAANDQSPQESEGETKEATARGEFAAARASRPTHQVLLLRTRYFARRASAATSRGIARGRAGSKIFFSRKVQKPLRNVAIGSLLLFGVHESMVPPGQSTPLRSLAQALEEKIGPTVERQTEKLRKLYQPRPPQPGFHEPAQPDTQFSRLRSRGVQHIETTKQRYRNWRDRYLPREKAKQVRAKTRTQTRSKGRR